MNAAACIGLSGIYAKPGKLDELLQQYNLSIDEIEEAMKKVSKKKLKD